MTMDQFAQEATARITAFVAGAITLDDLWCWLSRETWDHPADVMHPTVVNDALLWISEYSADHRSLEELRLLLAGALYLDTIQPHDDGSGVRLQSTATTIHAGPVLLAGETQTGEGA